MEGMEACIGGELFQNIDNNSPFASASSSSSSSSSSSASSSSSLCSSSSAVETYLFTCCQPIVITKIQSSTTCFDREIAQQETILNTRRIILRSENIAND